MGSIYIDTFYQKIDFACCEGPLLVRVNCITKNELNFFKYQYIFQIKRRSTFYVTVIIIPTFLIATLSIIGIFAPGSDNDTGSCV